VVPSPVSFPTFPWPPPKASASEVIPRPILLGDSAEPIDLGAVDRRITEALEKSGYFETSYYAVPDGFSIVSRLERIRSDGTPMDGPERWFTHDRNMERFSLSGYLRALFTANPGHYRIVVFIVSPHPFSQADKTVSREEAMNWLHEGVNRLPNHIGEISYSEQYSCTALIYEFERSDVQEEARTVVPGRLQGRTHLEKAGLWGALEG